MVNAFAVMIGGGLGALLRYSISKGLAEIGTQGGFPWATLCVNVIGAFLIGLLAELFTHWNVSQGVKLFTIIGVLGTLTTYSTTEKSTPLSSNKAKVCRLLVQFGL